MLTSSFLSALLTTSHLLTAYSRLTLSGKDAREVPASTQAEPTGHRAHSTELLAVDLGENEGEGEGEGEGER